MVLAGLIAEAENWAGFSEEWQQCLEAAPTIAYFRMSEAAGLGGQFWGWSAADRDVKVRKLAQITNRFVSVVIHCTMDLQGFKETFAAHSDKPLNEPYFWPFHTTIMAVGFDLLERGLKERCEVIFDEQVIFGRRARAWYPVIRAMVDPQVEAILPVDPIFRSDTEFLPLQGADMFAWCFRRGASRMPTAFDWILREVASIEFSKHSTFYSKERMQAIIEDSYKRKIAPEMVKKYRELLGLE